MPEKHVVIAQAKKILGSVDAALESLATAAPDMAPQLEMATAPDGLEAMRSEEIPLGGAPAAVLAEPQAEARFESFVARERTELIADGLQGMRKVEEGRDDLNPQEQSGLEAIILLTGRPALLIQNGDFLAPPQKWAALNDVRDQIKQVIARVGRIEVSNNPNFDWLGTGFLAGADSVITNRHVAMEFSRNTGGTWSFRAPMAARIDFREELGGEDPMEFKVIEIVGIHEDHDMAILRVEPTAGTTSLPDPLPVSKAAPSSLGGHQVYVIGYPAWDGRRNDPEPMLRIFSNIFNVKRLQPGEISGEAVASFEFFHDCSTLGGNSGSPVLDLETHKVVGLHFGGKYLEKNHAVPLWTLQQDPLVRQAGLNFQ
jgi:V8-like Glu-specific endopeptidase